MTDEHWHASCSSTPALEQHTRHATSESCSVSSGGCDSGCNFVDTASFGDRATDGLAGRKRSHVPKDAAAMASAGGSADAKVLMRADGRTPTKTCAQGPFGWCRSWAGVCNMHMHMHMSHVPRTVVILTADSEIASTVARVQALRFFTGRDRAAGSGAILTLPLGFARSPSGSAAVNTARVRQFFTRPKATIASSSWRRPRPRWS